MQIVIKNAEKSEPEALAKAIERAKRWDGDTKVEIHCNDRVPDNAPYQQPGWLEYSIIVYDGADKLVIFICMIQRNKDADFEFHS